MARRTVVDPDFPTRLSDLRAERGLSLRELATATYVSRGHLGDLETGRRPPSSATAAALDAALDADGVLSGMVSDDSPLAYAATHPRRVDAAAVAELGTDLAGARITEDVVGAGAMLSTAAPRLERVTGLAREARGPVRPQLVAVAGQWAQWAGWLHIATARWGRAGVWLDRALEWAVEVGDVDLQATVLSYRGYRALLMGHLGPAAGLTQAAMRDPRVCVDQRAYDRHQLARTLALAGDRREAGEALAAGIDLAQEATEAEFRPPWHYYRSGAFWALEQGLVHSLLGRQRRAEELVLAGLAGLPTEQQAADWTRQYRAAVSAP